jgi:LPXTG-motif cell wall-anchored protein
VATVSGGTATLTVTGLSAGSHSLSAVFTSSDLAQFLGSSSAKVSYMVTATGKVTVKSGSGSLGSGSTVTPGEKLTISGAGFVPGSTVTATIHSANATVIGTGVVNSSGVVVLTVTIPHGLAAGTHTVLLSGDGTTASFTVKVAASSSGNPATGTPTGSNLPHTGSDALPFGLFGLILLVVGAGLVLSVRRRA